MHDDRGYEAVHSTRAHLAELLDEERRTVAASVTERLRRQGIEPSPLVVRTLVHALTRAVAAGEPDIVVHWARMVRHAHHPQAVAAMIDAACTVGEEFAHAHAGDLATTIVFLEIVRSRASAHAHHDHAAVAGEPAVDTAIESLLAMLRARDNATCVHSQATGELSRRVAARMGLPLDMTERIAKAGALHDIGKIVVPDAILLKPGPLDEEEWRVMKRHAAAGAEILSRIPALAQYAPIVAAHHERWDGRGYPQGMRGDEILIEARIVAVADSFHAMTSERVYRGPLSYGDAIAVLHDGRGKQWDAEAAGVMITVAAEDRNTSADANLSALSTPFFTDAAQRAQGAARAG